MTNSKDLYKILGISKSASTEEIKNAYRKLALEYHPDRNKTKGAVVKFKEVTQAYEVLSDTQKRHAYDQLGTDAFDPNGTAQNHQHRAGKDAPFTYSYEKQGQSGFSDPQDIFDQFFGGTSPFSTHQPRQTYTLTLEFREAVSGVQKRFTLNGKQQTIKIPPGVDTGTKIRYGAFDIVMEVIPDPHFKRDGADILTEEEITFKQATLGDTIQIKTLDGLLKLKISPGTQPGTIIRLSGRGIQRLKKTDKGNLYVKIRVAIPRTLTTKQKELMEKF